jgi:hypothetical protein
MQVGLCCLILVQRSYHPEGTPAKQATRKSVLIRQATLLRREALSSARSWVHVGCPPINMRDMQNCSTPLRSTQSGKNRVNVGL